MKWQGIGPGKIKRLAIQATERNSIERAGIATPSHHALKASEQSFYKMPAKFRRNASALLNGLNTRRIQEEA